MRQTTYDYVIVGAGSAGSILANRLTENGKHTVLVLEAGPSDRAFNPASLHIAMPAGFIKTIVDPAVNWCFETEATENTNGRQVWYPRGKVLGGSSAINGHLYVRGQPQDYDTWAQRGNRHWSYDDVVPYFRRSEKYDGGEDDVRGRNGELNVTGIHEIHPINEAFIAGVESCGIPRNPDYNGRKQEGVAYYQRNVKRGKRFNAGAAFLRPAMKRPNLAVETEVLVERVMLDGRQATGVRYTRHGTACEALARREVIVSCGSIGSPHLLQISGVGPGKLLNELGIPVLHEIAGVGENLSDHYLTRVVSRIKPGLSLNQRARGASLVSEVARWFIDGKGLLAFAPGHVAVFAKSSPHLENPDLQFVFAPASFEVGTLNELAPYPGMTCSVWVSRPESQGYVHAKSPDPQAAPAINPNYLATKTDQDVMVAGLKMCRQFLETDALEPYRIGEEIPGKNVQSDDEWLDFSRQAGGTVYHPTGTCRMGPDPMSVVDDALKVRGIDRLRVVDASVMPTMVSGNTNATTMMIAEKGAEMILAEAASALAA